MTAVDRLEQAISQELSAAAFARKHGFSPAFICYVRKGQKKPSKRLKRALGITTKRGVSIVAAPWAEAA